MRAAVALLLGTAFGMIGACPSSGEIHRPWCVQYTGSSGDDGTSCAFVSYEQCMLTARGAGAYCVQNPRYLQYGRKGSDGSMGEGDRPKRR